MLAGWAGVSNTRRAAKFEVTEPNSCGKVKSDFKLFRLDLHIHTVLSPCTEIADMSPRAIVRQAVERHLDVIAVCDHNSARNVGATIRAAKDSRLVVIPGMEITSAEEVHIIGLFAEADDAVAVQDEVYARLPGHNDEEAFGCQVVADENDLVEDLDQRLLIGATTLSLEKVVDLIHRFEGIAIASHVDRESFGLFGQLGFIPDALRLDALEISGRTNRAAVNKRYPQSRDYVLVRSSDAHALDQIGAFVSLGLMKEPSFEELSMAFHKLKGRRILAEESG